MEPLQGSHEKPNPLSQGGASLTLGFDREPRCGSLVFCYPIAYKEPRCGSLVFCYPIAYKEPRCGSLVFCHPIAYKEPRCGSYGCFSISGETGSNDADTYEIKLL